MLKQLTISAAVAAFALSGAAIAQQQAAVSTPGMQAMPRASTAAPEDPGHGLVSGFDTVNRASNPTGGSAMTLAAETARNFAPAPLAPHSAQVP